MCIASEQACQCRTCSSTKARLHALEHVSIQVSAFLSYRICRTRFTPYNPQLREVATAKQGCGGRCICYWGSRPWSGDLLSVHDKLHARISARRFGAIHMYLDVVFDGERLPRRAVHFMCFPPSNPGGCLPALCHLRTFKKEKVIERPDCEYFSMPVMEDVAFG